MHPGCELKSMYAVAFALCMRSAWDVSMSAMNHSVAIDVSAWCSGMIQIILSAPMHNLLVELFLVPRHTSCSWIFSMSVLWFNDLDESPCVGMFPSLRGFLMCRRWLRDTKCTLDWIYARNSMQQALQLLKCLHTACVIWTPAGPCDCVWHKGAWLEVEDWRFGISDDAGKLHHQGVRQQVPCLWQCHHCGCSGGLLIYFHFQADQSDSHDLGMDSMGGPPVVKH